MRYHAANRFQTRLAASVDESQIYFDVESASGCPEVPFKLTVGTEIVNVIGVVGNTFTVQRGAEGTTPQGHPEGAFVQNRWTAGTYEDLWDGVDDLRDNVDDLRDNVEAHEANTTDAHGIDVIAGDLDAHKAETAENAHKVENITGLAFPAFQYATLLNSWTAMGDIGVRYRKNAQGVTNVQIFAKPNSTVDSTNNTFAKLPKGYRPAIRIAIPYHDGARGIVYNGVVIMTDGTVSLQKPGRDEIRADGTVSCEFVFIAKG